MDSDQVDDYDNSWCLSGQLTLLTKELATDPNDGSDLAMALCGIKWCLSLCDGKITFP